MPAKNDAAETPAADLHVRSPFEIEMDAVAKLGAKAAGVQIDFLDAPEEMIGVPSFIPVGMKHGDDPAVQDLSRLFEPYRLFPARKSGQAAAQTFEAFVELTNRHKTDDSTIFADADWQKPSFTAVIDYHQAASGGRAGFGKHRVHYAFPLSEEWQAWIKMNDEPMDQARFAYFLEDRVAELSSPTEHEAVTLEQQFQTRIATPAQVVELSRGLKVHVDTRIKQAVTLQSGEGQIAWEEAHTDGEGTPLKVPGIFMLQIAPFFMGDKIRLPVRLRYRPSGGKVIWSYTMYRPDLAITEHVRTHAIEAKEKTGLPLYEGKPEMAA